MSSRAPYNVPYEDSERDRKKKAFIRKRKRMRRLLILSFFAVVLLILAGIIALFVNIIKSSIRSREERMKYVEYEGEYKEIRLVDNSTVGKKRSDAFFEIYDDNRTLSEIKAERYKDIVPGSKGIVVVDAGHGGFDGGAADENGMLEKDLNLQISYKLKDELELRGYSVKLTRPDDEFVGLTERASIANSLDNPVCLISIHQNSNEESEGGASGMEAWTYDREWCKELGDAVVEAAASKTGARNRGTYFRKNLVVTSKTTMPAIIFECGYLTDSAETDKLWNAEYQELIAEGIVDGIDNFVDITKI